MEPEQSLADISSEKKPSIWNTVTPFSKYLAMALFIALPFLGGWVGYSFAPMRIIEPNKNDNTLVTTVDSLESAEKQSIFYNYSTSELEQKLAQFNAQKKKIKLSFEPETEDEYVVTLMERLNSLEIVASTTYKLKAENLEELLASTQFSALETEMAAQVVESTATIIVSDVQYVEETLEKIEAYDTDDYVYSKTIEYDAISKTVLLIEAELESRQ